MTKKELHSFQGLACYYRRFIPRFTTFATFLADMLKVRKKGGTPLYWELAAQDIFQVLK